MKTSKLFLLIGNFIFAIVLVYGTAIIARLFIERFLFKNGVTDIGYIYMTLGIALPCIFYSLISNKKAIEVLSIALFFVSSNYILVYLAFVVEGQLTSTTIAAEMIFSLIYFLLTIILIGIVHFELNKK